MTGYYAKGLPDRTGPIYKLTLNVKGEAPMYHFVRLDGLGYLFHWAEVWWDRGLVSYSAELWWYGKSE